MFVEPATPGLLKTTKLRKCWYIATNTVGHLVHALGPGVDFLLVPLPLGPGQLGDDGCHGPLDDSLDDGDDGCHSPALSAT